MLPVHEGRRNIRANFFVSFLQAISLSAAEGDFAIPKFPANLTKCSSPGRGTVPFDQPTAKKRGSMAGAV
jgi:hypothetical protein